jgi:hypothetical protein
MHGIRSDVHPVTHIRNFLFGQPGHEYEAVPGGGWAPGEREREEK